MITTETNQPFPNRIQVQCDSYTGPWTSARLGLFNPIRDMRIYVDGDPLTVQAFAFDGANNRYLIYAAAPIDLAGIVQVCYHIPDPPFYSIAGYVPPVVDDVTLNPTLAYNDGPGIVSYFSGVEGSYFGGGTTATFTIPVPVQANDVVAFELSAITVSPWQSIGYPNGFSGQGTSQTLAAVSVALSNFYGHVPQGLAVGYTCFAYAWITSTNAADALSITGVTDSLGNTWIPLSNQFNYTDPPRSGTNPICAKIFWCVNTVAVPSTGTLTVYAAFSGCTGTASSGVTFIFVQNTLSLISTVNNPETSVTSMSAGPVVTTSTRGSFIMGWAGPCISTITLTGGWNKNIYPTNSNPGTHNVGMFSYYPNSNSNLVLAPPGTYTFGPVPVYSGTTNGFAFVAAFSLPTTIPTLPETVTDNLGNVYTILSGTSVSGISGPEPFNGALYTSTGATGTVNGFTEGGTATIAITVPVSSCGFCYAGVLLRGVSTTLAGYATQNAIANPQATINSGPLTTSGTTLPISFALSSGFFNFPSPEPQGPLLGLSSQVGTYAQAGSAWYGGLMSAGTYTAYWADYFNEPFPGTSGNAMQAVLVAFTASASDVPWTNPTDIEAGNPTDYATVSLPAYSVSEPMAGALLYGTASIATPIPSSYSSQPNISVEFWFSCPTTGYSGLKMVGYGTYGTTSPAMGLHINSSGHVAFQQGGSDVLASTAAYNDGLIHHCVLTIGPYLSACTFNLYIDAVLSSTANAAFTTTGGSPPTQGNWVLGPLAGTQSIWLSHVSVWTGTTLGSIDITNHFNAFINYGQAFYENTLQGPATIGEEFISDVAAFSYAVQSNYNTAVNSSSITCSLPNPTKPGNVLMYIVTSTSAAGVADTPSVVDYLSNTFSAPIVEPVPGGSPPALPGTFQMYSNAGTVVTGGSDYFEVSFFGQVQDTIAIIVAELTGVTMAGVVSAGNYGTSTETSGNYALEYGAGITPTGNVLMVGVVGLTPPTGTYPYEYFSNIDGFDQVLITPNAQAGLDCVVSLGSSLNTVWWSDTYGSVYGVGQYAFPLAQTPPPTYSWYLTDSPFAGGSIDNATFTNVALDSGVGLNGQLINGVLVNNASTHVINAIATTGTGTMNINSFPIIPSINDAFVWSAASGASNSGGPNRRVISTNYVTGVMSGLFDPGAWGIEYVYIILAETGLDYTFFLGWPSSVPYSTSIITLTGVMTGYPDIWVQSNLVYRTGVQSGNSLDYNNMPAFSLMVSTALNAVTDTTPAITDGTFQLLESANSGANASAIGGYLAPTNGNYVNTWSNAIYNTSAHDQFGVGFITTNALNPGIYLNGSAGVYQMVVFKYRAVGGTETSSQYLQAIAYDPGLSVGDTVLGVELSITGVQQTSDPSATLVVTPNNPVIGAETHTFQLGTSVPPETVTFGSSTDLWDMPWSTSAEVNSGNFGFTVQGTEAALQPGPSLVQNSSNGFAIPFYDGGFATPAPTTHTGTTVAWIMPVAAGVAMWPNMGALLIVECQGGAYPTSLTDTAFNTWVPILTNQACPGTNSVTSSQFYCANLQYDATMRLTVTANLNASITSKTVRFFGFSIQGTYEGYTVASGTGTSFGGTYTTASQSNWIVNLSYTASNPTSASPNPQNWLIEYGYYPSMGTIATYNVLSGTVGAGGVYTAPWYGGPPQAYLTICISFSIPTITSNLLPSPVSLGNLVFVLMQTGLEWNGPAGVDNLGNLYGTVAGQGCSTVVTNPGLITQIAFANINNVGGSAYEAETGGGLGFMFEFTGQAKTIPPVSLAGSILGFPKNSCYVGGNITSNYRALVASGGAIPTTIPSNAYILSIYSAQFANITAGPNTTVLATGNFNAVYGGPFSLIATTQPTPKAGLVNFGFGLTFASPYAGSPAAATWEPHTRYYKGNSVIDPNGNLQVCVHPGISGATQPGWLIYNNIYNSASYLTEGTVTWESYTVPNVPFNWGTPLSYAILPDPTFSISEMEATIYYETSSGGGSGGDIITGPLNPGSGTNSGTGSPPSPDPAWSNPSNITVGSPSSYAIATLVSESSQLLIASDYGFSVPTGYIPLGVEVSITGKQSGGYTSVVFDQQTTPTTGTGSSISLGPLTPTESGEWAVFTAVFNENSTFGYFPQGGGSAVTAYTISSGTVTVTGTNNLIPGQTVMITSTGGTIDGVWLTVATATSSGWTAPTSLPDGGVGGAAALASVQGWVNLTLSGGQFYSPNYFGIWGAPIGSSTSFPAGEPLMDFDGGSKNWMGSLLLFKTNGSLPVPVNTAHLGNATIQSTTQSVTYGNVVMIWGVVTGATGDPIITDTQLNEYTIVSNQTQTISGYGDPVKNYVAVATMAATGVNVITVSQAYGVNLGDGWVAMVNELQNLVVPPNALFTVTPANPASGAESESFQLISGLPGNTTLTFGSPTNLWGMPWSTASAINADAFGFTVQASNPNTHVVAYEVSEVEITVYYTGTIRQPIPSFAQIPAYSTNGDEGLTPTAVLTVSPSSALSGQPVTLIWNTTNVAYVVVTAPEFNTGYLSTTGTGIYLVASGFTAGGSPPSEVITLTLAAYDSNKNVIIVASMPLTATATLTIT